MKTILEKTARQNQIEYWTASAQHDLSVAETLEFLDAVNTFNISTRYPDEKFKFYKLCTAEFTANHFNQIKEIYKWLLQKIRH